MATFEEQLKTLETVVERLEKGDLALEESLALFEQGVKLSDACKKELEAAEGRVEVLLQRGRGEQREAEALVLEEDE
ncbi:Exodeoxyribonuclease VII small subunit [Terriglobus roseus DSM 18391]|uniref:Exodeoxyribonuclease 7 small subunit n=1 Tax=Terriglobus roseus (strain DSM 18391 / NRRL B-41598 / KBS 63) TaxID=926566 RepID=I3ZIA7_TERRK|nr:exodeoxyribonuclease VII small subunit [Terriglobus roseus]AFL88975.1 Exodeoxyribonuclease VII small subunit [Terriglobus roseus DSM 18391]